MTIHDPPTTTRHRRRNGGSERRAEPLRVTLAAPPLGGVLRIVLMLVAVALALYLNRK